MMKGYRVDITSEFSRAKEKGLRICYNNDSSEFEIWDGEFVYSYYDEGKDKTELLKQKIQKEIDNFKMNKGGIDYDERL